jgi:predicted ATPase
MLKKLILENWKSFRYAELPLDPLTVLIGTNASGKSNVVEALEFLQRIVSGENIEPALAGDKTLSSIRGGVEWAARRLSRKFTLKVIVSDDNGQEDYLYFIEVFTTGGASITEEYIECLDIEKCDYITKIRIKNWRNNHRSGLKQSGVLIANDLFFSGINYHEDEFGLHLDGGEAAENTFLNLQSKFKNFVFPMLENILILNPIPSKMRDYSRLSENIEGDGSNIAGVLAALPEEQKTEVESNLSYYIKDLPEGDIKKVFAEPVGRLKADAMLYCEEEWKPGEITEIDARTMSDGTLRFLGILTALLTRPEGSQIVIEEIDNGLHPSRAALLVKILKEIGSKRNIDILLTTHNPALLDAFGPEIVPFVVVAHRDSETGESKLTLLEDIENLPLLLASGTLGRLATKGAIEKSLSTQK